jgi:hypothetical protein
VGVYNGTIAKDFYPTGVGGEGRTEGHILSDAKLWYVNHANVLPIALTFRPLSPHLNGTRLEEMKPTQSMLPIEGARFARYESRGPNAAVIYWLDISRDYVVRRVHWEERGRLRSQLEISYRQHDLAQLVPTSWVCESYGEDGALLISTKTENLEMQINQPVPAEQFEFCFPPGAFVLDNRDKGRAYRVRTDSAMREVNPLDYDKYLDLSSILQVGDPWYLRFKGLFPSFLAALGAIALIYFWGRKKVNRSA